MQKDDKTMKINTKILYYIILLDKPWNKLSFIG